MLETAWELRANTTNEGFDFLLLGFGLFVGFLLVCLAGFLLVWWLLKVSRNGREINISIYGQKVEQVCKFKYLGAWITEDGRNEVEIRTRLGMAKDAFSKRKELLTRGMSKEVTKKIVKTVIWSVAPYSAATRSL